jgi:hypothetical protein
MKFKEITGNDFGPPASSGKKKKNKAAAAAPPKPAPKPAPVPLESISEEELEACIKVLDAVGADATCIEDPRFKLLRRSVMPIVQYMRKKMFKGGSTTAYLEKQHTQREAEGRKAKQKALDQKRVNSVKLRAARVVTTSLIADGPVASAAAGVRVSEAGGAEQTEEEVSDPRSCYGMPQTTAIQSFTACDGLWSVSMAPLASLLQLDGSCPYHRIVLSSETPEELRESVGAKWPACETIQLPPAGWKGVIRNVPIADRIVDAPPTYALTVKRNTKRAQGRILVLDRLNYRGNIGSIVRATVQSNMFEEVRVFRGCFFALCV